MNNREVCVTFKHTILVRPELECDSLAIEHILVDLDGVIRLWEKDTSDIEKKWSLPVNAIAKVAFSQPLLNPAIRGKVSDEIWRENIKIQLSKIYPAADVERAVNDWSEYAGVIDNDVLALLGSYENHKMSLVTNATSRLIMDLSMLGIVDKFSTIFNTSDIGYIKPEKTLFEYILKSLELKPDAAVFIDDTKENCDAARELGIKDHHYTNIDSLEKFLATVLLTSS